MTLKPITISVHVPASVALARGESSHGTTTVELSDADIAGLSAGARALLAEARDRDGALVPGGSSLTVERADGPSACAAIEALVAERAAQKAKEKADYETTIAKAIAAPAEDWIDASRSGDRYVVASDGPDATDYALSGYTHYRPGVSRMPSGVYLTDKEEADPRIVERRAKLEREALPPLVAEWERRHAGYVSWKADQRAKAEAEARAKAEAKSDCEEALRELAKREDDLARAAADGYAIDKTMLDRLAERVADTVGVAEECYEIDSETWSKTPDRPAPRPDAFALRDRVESVVRTENERLPNAVGKWDVSRIVRVDVCPHEGKRYNVTAVLATLETPCGTRQITFSTESLECSHDGEDEG